jgi:hypothetical protein
MRIVQNKYSSLVGKTIADARGRPGQIGIVVSMIPCEQTCSYCPVGHNLFIVKDGGKGLHYSEITSRWCWSLVVTEKEFSDYREGKCLGAC